MTTDTNMTTPAPTQVPPSAPDAPPDPVSPDMGKAAVGQRAIRFGKVAESIVRSSVGSLWLSLKLSSLGAPRFTMSLNTATGPFMTAAVALGPAGEILFYFNPWFFDLSSDRLLRFAILHELYHVLYNHLNRGIELAERREAEIRGGSANVFRINHALWNIAIDCLANEKLAEQGILTPGVEEDFRRTMLLVQQHMYPTEPAPKPPDEGGVWLLSRVLPGFDEPWGTKLRPLRDMWTSERVYELLEAMSPKILFVFESGAVGAPVESTQTTEGAQGKLPPNTRVIRVSKEVQERAKQAAERAQAGAGKPQQGPEMVAAGGEEPKDAPPGARAGDGRHQHFASFKIVRPTRRRSWVQDTANIIARQLFPREAEQWVKPHKLLTAFYPDVLMANEAETEAETKTIYVLGDCSGSMTSLIPSLIGIAESSVKDLTSWKNKCIVKVFAFDTEVYDWPDKLRKAGQAPTSGGTAFQPLADFIEGRIATSSTQHHPGGTPCVRHPDLVYVVTDGQANVPKIRVPSRWVWAIVGGGHDNVNPSTPGIGRVMLYRPNE